MSSAWPPSWLTGVDPETLARIKATLDKLGGAELELRDGSHVCIFASPHCEPTEGRTFLEAIDALLVSETSYWKRRAERERKEDEAAKAAKPRFARWTIRKRPQRRE
jgi:transposase